MVASADSAENSKPITGHKVSKPLMEKKRRARINKCLDQLKSLLENHYSSNIRKRKLEKADILELTVKHLRSLQKIQSCSVAASDFTDPHRTGFRSCLAYVNQYLMMEDALNGGDRWTLSQLSSKLKGSLRGRGDVSSTMDSGRVLPEPRGEKQQEPGEEEEGEVRRFQPAAGAEKRNAVTSNGLKVNTSPPPPNREQALSALRIPCQRKPLSVSRRSDASLSQHRVWRPW